MKKITDRIYDNVFIILKYLSLFFAILLLLSSFIYTCYIDNMETQKVLTRTDNILLGVLGCCVYIFILKILLKWAETNTNRRCKFLLILTIGWYIFTNAVLLVFCRSAPGGDPMSVFQIAEQCAVGNLSAIHPTASYLSYYPHQIGLVAYYEILLRIWNLFSIDLIGFHFIKLINVFWTCLLIFCQYKTLDFLFRNPKINIVYLSLMICNVPLIFYTSFVYGEIPSISLFSLGYFCLLKLLSYTNDSYDKKSKQKLVVYSLLTYLAFIGCIMLRKNAMILMIAVMGVTLFEFIRHKKMLLLGILSAYLLITLCTLPIVRSIYEHRADNQLNSGVTPLSYIAMGMQESTRGDGWYNGFNFETYAAANLDSELANEISIQAIKERSLFFRKNLSYTISFYANKYRSQWCDGTYACLQATLSNLGGRSQAFQDLYNGKYDSLFIPFCNLIQLVLYLGCSVFTFINVKRKSHTDTISYPLYLGFIGVFGAFLFHMLWEANARYIFPYSLLLFPYAAYGLYFLSGYIHKPHKST